MSDATPSAADSLAGLRRRADEDFLAPPTVRQAGRHQLDLAESGLRVSVTRSRYPNRPDGVDNYAVTLSRLDLDRPPTEGEVAEALAGLFGDRAAFAAERPGGPLVRMFRVPGAPEQGH